MVNLYERDDKKRVAKFDRRPSFFKIMHAGINSERLRIPPHCVRHISKDTVDKATLRGPSGRCWKVQWNDSNDGCVYLLDGWQQFLRDQSLGNSEFVIFKYWGNMCFSVQIFDKSGLERTM